MYIQLTFSSRPNDINTAETNAHVLLVNLGSFLNFTGYNIKQLWNIMQLIARIFFHSVWLQYKVLMVEGIDSLEYLAQFLK